MLVRQTLFFLVALMVAPMVLSKMEDRVVPEVAASTTVSSKDSALTPPPLDAHQAAVTKIKTMQLQGATTDQCKQLAEDTISKTTKTITALQAQVDALSTGSQCKANADTAAGVAAALTAVNDATTAVQDATSAVSAAQTLPISASVTKSVAEMDAASDAQLANWVRASSTHTSQVAAITAAESHKQAMMVAQGKAQGAHAATVAASSGFEKICLCETKSQHETVTTNAQTVVTDSTQPWNEAHHMKCALDGNPKDACAVPKLAITIQPLIADATVLTDADCTPPATNAVCSPRSDLSTADTWTVKQYNGRDYVTLKGMCGVEGINGEVYQRFYFWNVPDEAACAAIGQAFYDQDGAPAARCASWIARLNRCDIFYDLGHTPIQVGKGLWGRPSPTRSSITTAEGDEYKVSDYSQTECPAFNDNIKTCLAKLDRNFKYDTCASTPDACAVRPTSKEHTSGTKHDDWVSILLDGCAGAPPAPPPAPMNVFW